MSIKIQHTDIIKGSSVKEICAFMQHDLKNENGWQAFTENNKIYWKDIKPVRYLLRKPTDYIQKGEIKINELEKGTFKFSFLYSPKIPFYLIVVYLSIFPLAGLIIKINNISIDLPQFNEFISLITYGGPIMITFFVLSNLLYIRWIMKSNLIGSIDRFKENKTEPNNGEHP